MRVRAPRAACLAAGLLLAGLAIPATPRAATGAAVSGTTRDALGRVLGNVEILVLAERGIDPVAVVRTGEDGRFSLTHLPLGVYRLVAVKDGYATWIGRVSTGVRATVDLVLRPAAAEDVDPTWALRVPDRSLLRETEPVALLHENDSAVRGRGGPAVAAAAQEPVVQGRVEHLFALASDPPTAGPRGWVQGGETRVRLASRIGSRAGVRVEGRRDALDPEPEPGGVSELPRENAGVQVDLSYDTSLDGQLQVRAFYAARGAQEAGARAQGARRAWGYDASWSRQLDAASRLALQMAYLDTGLDAAADPRATSPLSSRTLGAQGAYETGLGERHRLRIALRARTADLSPFSLPSDTLADTPGISMLGGVPDAPGWGVRFEAEDAMRVNGSTTLLYGVGYEEDVSGAGLGQVAEHVGASWSGRDARLDLRVSHHTGSAAEGGPAGSPLGWSSAVEVPLPFGIRVRAEALSSPVHDESLARDLGGDLTGRPVYLTDGRASTRQGRVRVQRQALRTLAYLEVVDGTAEGRLAQVAPVDLTVEELEQQRLAFVLGRLGLRLTPTGTDLVAEYRRVQQEDVVAAGGPLDSLELRLAQDLQRLEGRGARWRLLLAARASRDAAANDGGDEDGDVQRWMGAGISVAF